MQKTLFLAESIPGYLRWLDEQVSKSNVERNKLVLGFVPTMGALHDGHRALIRKARQMSDLVVVSIYVNPTQFCLGEDFDKYPRTLQEDMRICSEEGVDCVFHPSSEEMYGKQSANGHPGDDESCVIVPPPHLTERLCGKFRPGHFIGVATVVAKLFNIVRPEYAFFGEKDYQQLAVIKRMALDLNFSLQIVPVETVRETSGLAMSSRNKYLTTTQKELAPEIYKVLSSLRQSLALSDSDFSASVAASVADGIKRLESKGFTVQYLEVCDPETLLPLERPSSPMVLLVAAKLGEVRLIDNLIV